MKLYEMVRYGVSYSDLNQVDKHSAFNRLAVAHVKAQLEDMEFHKRHMAWTIEMDERRTMNLG